MNIKQKNVTRLNAAIFSAIILAGASGTVFAMQPNPEITDTQRDELHTLMQEGDFEGVEALREELGFAGKGFGHGMHGMHESGMHGNEDIRQTVEDNNYDAWKNAMEEQAEHMIDNINEDHFNTLVEIHDLREVGRYDEARDMQRALHDEIRL